MMADVRVSGCLLGMRLQSGSATSGWRLEDSVEV